MKQNDGLERIKLLMERYGLSQRQFALKIGMSPQTLNTSFKNDGELKLSVIQDILRAFPEVSTDWLVMGEGDMMKASGNGDLVEALRDHIATLKENNALLKEKLSAMEAEKNMEDGKRLPVDHREKVAKGEKA